MPTARHSICEKDLPAVRVAAIRMRGKYSDCGTGFKQIARHFGRHLCGKAMMLIHDTEFKEHDADFEVCMPVRKGESVGEIQVRELPAGRCLSLVHEGPYDRIGQAYATILSYVTEHNLQIQRPTREVYLKGPGMIFRGNPEKYLTEIQLPLASS